jgi:hypothetical protein
VARAGTGGVGVQVLFDWGSVAILVTLDVLVTDGEIFATVGVAVIWDNLWACDVKVAKTWPAITVSVLLASAVGGKGVGVGSRPHATPNNTEQPSQSMKKIIPPLPQRFMFFLSDPTASLNCLDLSNELTYV